MTTEESYLGIVHDGRFWILRPPSLLGRTARLTVVQLQAAQPPEGGELDLRRHEGSAIMVQGWADSGWIYGARIVDQAGPILTAVVQQMFGRS